MNDEQIAKDPVWRRHFRFFTVRSLIESFGISHYAAKFLIYLATSGAFREQCGYILCPCCRSSMDKNAVLDTSYNPRLGNGINGSSMIFNHIQPSIDSSMYRLGVSKGSLAAPSKRWSVSSWGSRVISGERRPSYVSRQRPQPGISRTVLNEIGERVQMKT